jgi:peptidoglycan/LPS O-acetylase OafA/YrhL
MRLLTLRWESRHYTARAAPARGFPARRPTKNARGGGAERTIAAVPAIPIAPMKSLNLPYNPRLDQLRWLAASLVFGFHFLLEYHQQGGLPPVSPWWGIVTQGHTGVGLFFTLSGYLFMQIALHQGAIHYGDFLRNRVLRILPLFLTIFFVALSVGRDKFQPQDLLYVFATNYGLAPTSYTPITGAAWTISLEFSFYLVFPFLARFALERGPGYLARLVGLMAFFKLAAFSVSDKPELMYFSTFVGRFDQFLVGMLAAQLAHGQAPLLRRIAPVAVPVTLLLAVASSALQTAIAPFDGAGKSAYWIVWSLQESVVWSLVIVAWLAFDRRLPGWLERVLVQGGKISFSFYLLHMALLHLLATHFGLVALVPEPRINAVLLLLATYALTWGLATVSYNAIEEPFLGLRRRYGTRGAPAAAPADAQPGA